MSLYDKYRGQNSIGREEALEDLRQVQEMGDREVAHMIADRVLTAYIDDDEIVEAFEKIGKWYA